MDQQEATSRSRALLALAASLVLLGLVAASLVIA
jgi:hypothetical protein